MKQLELRAMGADVMAVGHDDEQSVADWFADAEAVFSRFLPDSELSKLNNSDSASVEVSEHMAACLSAAQDLRMRTNGLVDPAIGAALMQWGYNTTFAGVADLESAPSVPDIGEWSVDGRVVSRQPGTRLDLGGIAKGWTCDQAVAHDLAAVVSAGGDVRSAHPETVVAIVDPWGETVIEVVLGHGGLATSSTTRRRWDVAGKAANHIIDPRTMKPAFSPVYSATVMAASAVEAEAGAKAVLLHGEHGLAWAERQLWIRAALVVWHDGSVYATTGWEQAA